MRVYYEHMARFYNRPTSLVTRRVLRQTSPAPEMVLWQHLKARQFFGFKFRRQYSIGSYVTDFYCPAKRIAIEIDGESHFESQLAIENDKARQQYIESCGIAVIRFTNQEIMKNLDGVLSKLTEIFRPSS